MNAPERMVFPDMQSQFDSRNIHIDAVGVKGVRYPETISARVPRRSPNTGRTINARTS
jgi:GTP cyclohydrolase FolE2